MMLVSTSITVCCMILPFRSCNLLVDSEKEKAIMCFRSEMAIHQEFIIRVNDVGVDINHCLLYDSTVPLLQFVGGLGKRKGNHVLQIGNGHSSRVYNSCQ